MRISIIAVLLAAAISATPATAQDHSGCENGLVIVDGQSIPCHAYAIPSGMEDRIPDLTASQGINNLSAELLLKLKDPRILDLETRKLMVQIKKLSEDICKRNNCDAPDVRKSKYHRPKDQPPLY